VGEINLKFKGSIIGKNGKFVNIPNIEQIVIHRLYNV